MKKTISFLLMATFIFSFAATCFGATDTREYEENYACDDEYVLCNPAPWNLFELKQVVDVKNPRSVAAYFVWSVCRLTDNFDEGMEMMKYLFADIDPFGKGFTEGGISQRAGWDTYFNERLNDSHYNWLPRAYFDGGSEQNGFTPNTPLTLTLYYNQADTEGMNSTRINRQGRLNYVYQVKSFAGGNLVKITVTQFEGSDRFYVTSGTTSAALFYDQRGAVSASTLSKMEDIPNDYSTKEEHIARYGTQLSQEEDHKKELPFTDLEEGAYYIEPVAWAYNNKVTSGTTNTTFGPEASCTRGQVVTFLWRAAGCPVAQMGNNPFNDVDETDYYYDAVLWAVENGITAGTSKTEFSPDDICSSAHIITFLYRAENPGKNGWYEEAKAWAKAEGVLTHTGMVISPDEECPRGAVVTFLHSIYK